MSAAVSDPEVQSALAACVESLRNLADYELDAEIVKLMHELGKRKEYLNEHEHAELLALVAFSERRSLEKLHAQVALKKLARVVPQIAAVP